MAGELTAHVGWALWSKQAGTRSDYSVIGCSREPFDRAACSEIITRFAVGTPDTTATGAGALPWVTVSWVGVDATLHLGIAITDRTDQFDGSGRPITQTSYYCVPYAPLAAAAEQYKAPVSYAALLKAVMERPLQPRDGDPITLSIEPVSAELLASVVHKHGEQVVASTAAMLLSGPVGIIGADGASLRERLDFIDAVASLLPHGYRTKFSASTWSQGGTRHRVRLAFGAYPREDGATVTWRRGAESAVLRDAARAYFDQVSRLTTGPKGALTISAVIEHLAVDTEPRRFEQPQDAIDSLNRLDLPFRVLRAVREGTGADLAGLRQVVQSSRAKELLTEADRVLLAAELAGRGDVQDWPLLRREASMLRSADDRTRIFAAFGRRMLWTATPPEGALARDCLRRAAELSVEDAVLAGLLRLPDTAAAADLPTGLQAAAELLAETVLASRRNYPRAREALASDLITASEYVAALSRSGRAGSFLSWLDPAGSSMFARAFRAVLGGDEGWVSEEVLAEFGPAGADFARLLLQVASQTGHLEKVLPGFTNWLAGRGELGDDERRYWATHLYGLAPRSPQAQAYLDTTLLMTGGLPSGLPPSQPKGAVDYGTYVATIWTGLSRTYPSFNAEGCVQALAGYLTERPWATTPEQALGVSELVKRLHDFDPGRSLAKTVAGTLAATPAARTWEFAQEWLAWAATNEPEAVRGRLLDSLAAPPSGDPDYLARLCVNACAEGIDPGAALTRLGKSGALTDAMQAYQLYNALRQRFEEAGIDDDTTAAWEYGFVELAAKGKFGTGFLPELRAVFFEEARATVLFCLRLVATFAEDDRDGKDRQFEWTDGEQKELTAIADELDSMLRKARKFQRPRKLRNPFGGGPEEDASGQVPRGGAEPVGLQDTLTMPGHPE